LSGAIFWPLLLLVVLAPLPLGANREWAWNLCAVIAAALALGWSVQALARPARVSLSLPAVPTALFLAVLAWAFLQTAPAVGETWAHPLWALDAEVLGRPVPGRISLAPDDTFTAMLRLLSYGLVFFLAFQFGRSERRARAAFAWTAMAGLAYACYGLLVFWSDFGTLPWFRNPAFQHDVHGTFVNRNSFATWLGLSLLCALAMLYQRASFRRNPAYRLPADPGQRVEQVVLRVWQPLAAVALITAALVLTHSRGGFFSTLAGVAVLLVLLNARQRLGSLRARVLLVSLLALVTVVFWTTSEVLMQRVDRLNASYFQRLEAYALARDAIDDNPLLGFGYGTFSDSFRLYRDETLKAHFDRAHNTYLENIFELGWPAAALLFGAVAWLAAGCLRGARNRGRDWVYPAAGLAATVLVGVHSLFDFSLQMPATAMAYALVLGVGCAQAQPAR